MTQFPNLAPTNVPSPQVSVVIPAYNAAAYISETLRSVFAQTFSDFEVILVNDGSPDTVALKRAVQPFLPQVRLMHQENRGPSSARNLGIREARGKYVAFLDSDDYWFPHHLAKQVEMLQKDPTLGLVYSNALHLKNEQSVGLAFSTVPQSGEPTLNALLQESCTINTSSVVVLRDALLQAGLFDESMNRCEDFDLWLRLAYAGVRMAYDREVQVSHRLGEGLAADKVLMKQGRIRAYEKMMLRPDLSPARQALIRNQLRQLQIETHLEVAKQSLLNGQYQEALTAATLANSQPHGTKLNLAILGLRYFPRLLRRAYRFHLRVLDWRRRRAQKHATKDLTLPLVSHRPLP